MNTIVQLLGDKADYLLNFKNPKIPADRLHAPGPDVVDRLFAVSGAWHAMTPRMAAGHHFFVTKP